MGGRGGNTSGAVVGNVRDCLNLRKLELLKQQKPPYRQGMGAGQGQADACSNLHRDPHLFS